MKPTVQPFSTPSSEAPAHWPRLADVPPSAVPADVWSRHGGEGRATGTVPLLVGPGYWHGLLPVEAWPAAAERLLRRRSAALHPVLVPDAVIRRLWTELPEPDAATSAARAQLAEREPPAIWPLAWPAGLAPRELARHLLLQAVALGLSDLHLEAGADQLRLSGRRHGRIRPLPPLTGSSRRQVVDEIRTLAGLTPLQQGHHAEGRLRLSHAGRDIDFRVQSQPAIDGEALTLRVLDPLRLAALRHPGLLPAALRTAADAFLAGPGGLLLITGPTDSGKTTTLHALLGRIDATRERVITLESPVEYRMPGLLQIPVDRDPESGHGMAPALASCLRAAPDILVCGELRTAAETAIALEAALTGHRVMATLHSGDAEAALRRMEHLGARRSLLEAAIPVIIAQRLGPRPCAVCARPEPVPAALAERLRAAGIPVPPHARTGHGCTACDGGVDGRSLIGLALSPAQLADAAAAWLRTLAEAVASGSLTAAGALRLLPAAVPVVPGHT